MEDVVEIPHRNIELAIFGGGYLGSFVGEIGRKYYRKLYTCVASPRARPRLDAAAVEVRVGDVFADASHILPQSKDAEFDVIFMIPPTAIADSNIGFANLLRRLAAAKVRRALLISSTGVYNVADGALVSAETGAGDVSGRGAKLKHIEDQWLTAGTNFSILRLAGIYGPGRVIGLNSLRVGKPVGGEPDAWLNLIHVEDAAMLGLHCLGERAETIELGADGNPVRRGVYYRYIASLLDLPAPDFSGSLARNTHSKRCDPSTTFARLGFYPRFDNYSVGVPDSLKLSEE